MRMAFIPDTSKTWLHSAGAIAIGTREETICTGCAKPAIGTGLKQRVVAHRCAVDLEAAVPKVSTSIAMVARVAGMSGAT